MRSFLAKRAPSPPLYFDNEPINFEKEVKYLGVYLDSTLTWKTHINYIIKKFYTVKNDLAHLLYSNEMSINNKVLLYETILRPKFLYAAPVWQPILRFKKSKSYKINFYALPVNSHGTSAIKLSKHPQI